MSLSLFFLVLVFAGFFFLLLFETPFVSAADNLPYSPSLP